MLYPLFIIEGQAQTLPRTDSVMIITLRANIEILIDLAVEEHQFTTGAFHKKPFGANSLLLFRVYRLRLVFSLKPTHGSRGRGPGAGGRLVVRSRPLPPDP